VDPNEPVGALQHRIESEKNVPIHQQQLCADSKDANAMDPSLPLASYGISENGAIVHLQIDPNAAVLVAGPNIATKKKIGADGSIIAVEYEVAQKDKGFRPGMPQLRDIKKAWTLTDFLEMDEQFVFRFDKPKDGEAGDASRKSDMCLGALLPPESMGSMTSCLQGFGWGQCRMAYLYGTVEQVEGERGEAEAEAEAATPATTVVWGSGCSTNGTSSSSSGNGNGGESVSGSSGGASLSGSTPRLKHARVVVECLYEPPQESSPEGVCVLEDPREEQVSVLASLLGLRRVGWVYGHPPREKGFLATSGEVQTAAVGQLEFADGIEKCPFVTIRMSPEEDGTASVDALQVTLQCMRMVAEGALEVLEGDRASSKIVDTFTAVVEGKEGVQSVDNSRFLLNVPVLTNEKPKLRMGFPAANRPGALEPQSPETLKRCILDSNGSVTNAVRDFNLLLYLMDFREMFDWEHFMPRICEAAMTPGAELDEGDKLIISSVAGLD